MLFYNFDILDYFIEKNLICNLKNEKENIKQIINLYENKKSSLLAITTNMIEITDFLNEKKLEGFHQTISLLKESFETINNIQSLASQLKKDLNQTISLYSKSFENNKDEIKANLVEYNKKRDELSNKIFEFENTNTTVLKSAIELSLEISHKKLKNQKVLSKNNMIKKEAKVDIELEPHDNNVLIISEKEQKAYLPFFYSEVKNIFQNSNNQYQTMQDIVDDLYVVSLDKFKNSAIARFREAFYLIRNKEKGSITKALDLGLELMFNYSLNPIVVTACRSLDELDIYLDCLEENELYDFNCFEIKFEVMPQFVKNKKQKNTF